MRKILVIVEVVSILFLLGCDSGSGEEYVTDPNELQRVTQTLVAPPFLPAHEQVAEGEPKVVEVRMVVEEKLMEISPDGTKSRLSGLTVTFRVRSSWSIKMTMSGWRS